MGRDEVTVRCQLKGRYMATAVVPGSVLGKYTGWGPVNMTRAGGVVWMLTEVREMLTAEGTVYSMERAMWAMGAHGVSDGVRGVHMGAKICVGIC